VAPDNSRCPLPTTWPALSPDATCTTLTLTSVTPNLTTTSGGDTIYLTGTSLSQPVPYDCRFGDRTSPATIHNSTTISCTTPAGTAVGPVNLTISYNGTPMTVTTVPFLVTISCPAGSYVNPASGWTHCERCPVGGVCKGGRAMPVSAPGFVSSPVDSAAFLECFRRESCGGNDTCAVGYHGPRCV
ncbi:hypothetical protein HK104_008081, partial [Borealophlyctis nickersoniae]